MGKFEIDLKWASYFFIVNVLVSIVVALFAVVFFFVSYEGRFNSGFITNLLLLFFAIELFYFVRKAIKENKEHRRIRFFSKVSIFFRVLVFYFFNIFLMSQSTKNGSFEDYFILYHRK